jgi:HlyD family secretion protein
MNRKRAVFLIGLTAVGLAAVACARLFHRDQPLQGSGTVEARNIRVGSEIGGRIQDVRVREGDVVKPGDVLITFDERPLRAELDQARTNYEKIRRGSRPEEIAQARATAAQAKADYELKRNGSRKEDIEAARADLERAKADAVRADRDFKRVNDLANAEIYSKQQRDEAEAASKMAAAVQRNAEQKLAELEHGFRPEEVASAEAAYRAAEANLEKTLHGNRQEDIDFAKAQLDQAEAHFREREVLAPASATVEVLDIRPGDLIPPNTPIATLLERDQIYVRIYISETMIGQVRVGQSADIRVDSFPKQVFPGVVEQINQKAEFLPRNVQTKEERAHQVIGIKLRIEDPSHRVLAGMAADVTLKP